MNKDEMKLWIEALRSGKYQQTDGALQNKYGYCCLGVACKVLIPEDKQQLDEHGFLLGGLPHQQLFAPEWLMVIGNGEVNGKVLSILNDDFGYTFEMIADLLEETYINK